MNDYLGALNILINIAKQAESDNKEIMNTWEKGIKLSEEMIFDLIYEHRRYKEKTHRLENIEKNFITLELAYDNLYDMHFKKKDKKEHYD